MAPAPNAVPAGIVALLPKLSDADADIRYMSLSDLDNILKTGSAGFLTNEYHTCARTVDCLLKTLDDTNGEVQNQAIKCIGSLTPRAPPELLPPMVEKLSTLKTTNSVDASIPATALRVFITAFPRSITGAQPTKSTQEAYSAISKVLIPRLVGYVVMSNGSRNQPTPPPGMLEVHADNTIDSNAIDVLIELIRCFGSMLQDPEKNALQKSTMAIFDNERTGTIAKKKAVLAISLLAVYMSDILLNTFVYSILESLNKPNLTAAQHRLLITMVGSLARTVPQRFGQYLRQLIPFILGPLSEQAYRDALEDTADTGTADTEADEVREAALLALEGFLSSCSNDMRPYTDEAMQAAIRFVAYDPNVSADTEDEEMGGTRDSVADDDDADPEEEDEDFEEEGAVSDDDDASWKVRRCAAKALYAIISTRSNGDLLENGILYEKIAPVLISRFREREENVRVEVLSSLTALVRKTSDNMITPFSFAGETEFELSSAVEVRSRKRRRLGSDATLFESPAISQAGFKSPDASPLPSSGPKADLARLSSSIIRGVSNLLQQSTLITKQSGIALLRDMVNAQNGGLSEHLGIIAEPVIDAIRSPTGHPTSHSAGAVAQASTGKLRIEALQLVGAICDNHSSTLIAPYASNLVVAVIAAVQDKYFKVSGEAIMAVESLIKVLTPPRSAGTLQANRNHVEKLYNVVLERTVATDADVEVRQRAIHALGVLLVRGSELNQVRVLSDAQRMKTVGVLLDRLRNETTRVSAAKAIDMFLSSCKDASVIQKDWTRDVAIELGTQLRKANRGLRGVSLATLRDLVGNAAALSCLDDKTVQAVTEMLFPLVSSHDLNLLGMALIIFAKLVRQSPKNVVNARLITSLCDVVVAPLGGAVLDALLVLLKAIGEQKVGQPLMQSLLQDVGVNGDPTVVGKAIGTLVVSGGTTVGVKLDDFVTELHSAPDDKRKCLALSVLGEAGYRLGSSSPLEPGLFTKYFGSKSQSLPRAAATALGRAGAGNVKTYVPVILTTTSEAGSSQYLSLHAIKEILQFTGQARSDISPYIKQMWEKLIAASQAEDNKAVGAECIGRLTVIEPKTFLPSLQVRILILVRSHRREITNPLSQGYLHNAEPSVRGMAIQAIRFTLSDSDETFDEVLRPILVPMLRAMMNDPNLENRRLALGVLNSATHNKADTILPNLTELVPLVMKESIIKPELIREVMMGPFKHKVDDGLEVRKVRANRNLWAEKIPMDLFSRIIAGLEDEHEIKVLSNLMLSKLVYIDAEETSRHLDSIAERYRSILAFKPKENAVKQEVEKLNEANKGVLKVTLLLHEVVPAKSSAGNNVQSEKWKGYWDWVKENFRSQLAIMEQELRSQTA
ncbi:MAG: hypothetical protein Q9185_005125 [Variospora sp. 1 TL-2023]